MSKAILGNLILFTNHKTLFVVFFLSDYDHHFYCSYCIMYSFGCIYQHLSKHLDVETCKHAFVFNVCFSFHVMDFKVKQLFNEGSKY